LSLEAAFIGLIFLFFLVFCLYFSWEGFFSSPHEKAANDTGALEDSPEWRALLNRRLEIDSDPTLDEVTRTVLIENWKTMACETRPHMSTPTGMQFAQSRWNKPALLPAWIAGSLVLSGLFAYSVGAFHPGAFQFPGLELAQAPLPSVNSQANPSAPGHPGDGVSLEERLISLQARLAKQPDDLQGWVLLGRTHAAMSNYSGSAQALKKALELNPGHPDILADLADMTAMAQGRQLAGEPETYIQAALQSEPRHEKALALAASAAEQANDPAKAQVYWQLLSQVQQQKLKGGQPASGASFTTVNIEIPQVALQRAGSNSALFVFLKAQPAAGMPLAVVKVPVQQLDIGMNRVQVNADNFIQPDALQNLPAVVHVQARLSVLGTAESGPGDFSSQWVSRPVTNLSSGVGLTLSSVAAAP
jgi:cytochrome c-type biogenesis protein CcmH/NrfG